MVIPETEGGSLSTSDDAYHLHHHNDRRLSLIDVSSADDSLFADQHSESATLLYTPNSKKFEDSATKLEEWEQGPQPNRTLDVENPKKNSKCNLRKSLAWDNAFFTSAGVLDAEELSSIIECAEKNQKRALPLLPAIVENVHKSCESISTQESGSLTLQSLEADLFEDVRASIQKSTTKSNGASANRKVPSGVAAGFQTAGESSEKVGMASRNKAPPPSSRSPSAGMQGKGKMTNRNPISTQLSKPVATRGEPSILKQPKMLRKSSSSSTISSKRPSRSGQHVRSEKNKPKRIINGKVSSVSNTSVIRGSRVTVPKPTMPSKSSSGLLVASKTKSTTSASSGSNLPGNPGKSPLNSLDRKVDSGTEKPLSSYRSIRTPSKIGSRDKTGSSISGLSSLLSVTKLSSSISPASSVSDVSSVSSPSISMTKYRSNSPRTSSDSISSRKQLGTDAQQGSSSQNPRSDSRLGEKDIHRTRFSSKCARTAAPGTVLPLVPTKPSSLRLPSPKLGYFDGVKSSMCTSRGGTRQLSVTHRTRSLPKHGMGSVSPREAQNKAKVEAIAGES